MIEDLPPSSPALEKLVSLIRDATGNIISPARYSFLEEVAQRRARSRGMPSVNDYVHALSANSLEGEWENLIPLVTIKESYFFRAPQQFEVVREHVLPKLMQARSQTRHLRIWSAACARGEEPATLAMILDQEPALQGWDWTIVATDVDEAALAGARLGLYGDRAVNQVPPHLLERYFHRRGKLFELDPALRERILYRQINLAHTPFALPFTDCDLVLLRNVLIYFRRPLQRWVIAQVSKLLAPHGYLFLGASETLWQIQDHLEAVDLGSCFCYRHRTGPTPAAPALPAKPVPVRTRPPAPPPAAPPPRPRPAPPPEAREEPPVPAVSTHFGVTELLSRAARDLADNRIDEAARVIEQLMETDTSDPEAYALEGFLHDLTGRSDDATASYRAALYLDPALFQVRVLLADCLLRLGHRDLARHQYREALATLDSGRERTLALFADLPLPDRDRARRRCQEVLRRG
ncbi:MAG TPA: CheR family methyltransferase [Thermoanaerobaculia bacterium]|nr:CheR family methyltransferase [Thermoanaerobaculia bacterium]